MQVEIAKLERDCPYSLFAGDRVKEVVTTYCLVLAVEEHSQMIYFHLLLLHFSLPDWMQLVVVVAPVELYLFLFHLDVVEVRCNHCCSSFSDFKDEE